MTWAFHPPSRVRQRAHIQSMEDYERMYRHSTENPSSFWDEAAGRLTWFERWHTTPEWDFHVPVIAWFCGGKLNACYNCVDRHVISGKGNKPAIIWVGNERTEQRCITYDQLLVEVQRATNVLKSLGVTRGDRVAIYLQMVPELLLEELLTGAKKSQLKKLRAALTTIKKSKQKTHLFRNIDRALTAIEYKK